MIRGRRDKAPCGHIGEVIIGTFVRCIEGCEDDSAPEDTLRIPASAMCPYCGSPEVKPFVHMFMNPDTLHCLECGKLFR